jgi:hypothetical protein
MTAPYKGSICLATNSNFVLPGSRSNDMLIYIGNSNQNILFGISNQNTLLSINSSNNSLAFSGNISFSNQLALSGIMLTQKTSTTVNNLTSSLTAINGFNYTSNGSIQISMSNGNTNIQFQQANTTYMTLTSNGFLGIGTTNPGSLLSIAGGHTIGAAYSNLAAPINGLIVQGNVGIGITNPAYNLDINGNARISGPLSLSNAAVLGSNTGSSNIAMSIQLGINNNVSLLNILDYRIATGSGYTTTSTRIQRVIDTSTFGYIEFSKYGSYDGVGIGVNNNTILTVNSANNVGIGTSNPNALYSMMINNTLQVNAANNAYNKLLVLYDNGPTDAVNTACNFSGFGINGGTLRYQVPGGNQHQWFIGNNVNLILSNSILTIPNLGATSNYTPTFRLSDGNKGIQYSGVNSGITWLTNFPTDGIAVYGFNDGCLGTTSGGNKAALSWNNSGNVGIGLSNPAYTLDVYASSGINSRFGSNLYLMGGPLSPSIGFNAYYNSGWFNGGVGTTYSGALLFLNGNFQFLACPTTTANGSNINSSLPTLVSISNNGNVGIGTTSPQFPLHIASNAQLITSSYAGDPGQAQFIVSGSTNPNQRIGFLYDTNSNIGLIQSMIFGIGPKPLCLNAAGGNIGINTTSPSYPLDVNGIVNTSTSFKVTNSGYMLYLEGGSGATDRFGVHVAGVTRLFASYNYTPSAVALSIAGSTAGTFTDALYVNHSGNVGIGTTNPAYTLEVNGTSHFTGVANFNTTGGTHAVNIGGDLGVTGTVLTNSSGNGIINTYSITCTTISKSSGTFDIQHPIDNTKRLVHSFIEGPRCDLIYRGIAKLINGMVLIDIDSQCTAEVECGMTTGTFAALCTNPQVFTNNADNFDAVLGVLSNNSTTNATTLTITCQNTQSTSTVSWMVVAERKDPYIKSWDHTNSNGYLQTEYTI